MTGEEAYKKWLDASNYIASSLINEVFANHYPFSHGPPSTRSNVSANAVFGLVYL